jgi:hypothetical protein
MLPRLTICGLAVVSLLCLPRGAAGQATSHLSVEASAGFRVSRGGTYHNRGGMALDVVVAYRLRDAPSALITGVAVGAQTPPLVRELSCLLLPDGGCAPDFPALFSVAALLGVQRGSSRTTAGRLFVGPTYHQAMGGGGSMGLQGRVDVSSPPWMQTAAVASLRHTLLPSFRGEEVGITSFGVGLRMVRS